MREEELIEIKAAYEGKITIMETKKTAYGNLVLANDKGAVCDPRLKEAKSRKSAKPSASKWCRRK